MHSGAYADKLIILTYRFFFKGEHIFHELMAKSGEVNVSIVNNGVKGPDNDLDQLISAGN